MFVYIQYIIEYIVVYIQYIIEYIVLFWLNDTSISTTTQHTGWLLPKIHIHLPVKLNDVDDANDIIIIIITVLAVLFTFCMLSQRVRTEVLEMANWNKLDKGEEFILNVQSLSAVPLFGYLESPCFYLSIYAAHFTSNAHACCSTSPDREPDASLRWFFRCHNEISFGSHYSPGVDSASNRNEYQEYLLGGKGGRCVGLTTLPPSCADCLEIWEPQLPGTIRACPGL